MRAAPTTRPIGASPWAIWPTTWLSLIHISGLQQQIQDSEAALEAQKQQDGEGLNEQGTADEIAEVVSAWTGVPVSKMMQGELDKLKGLEGELHKRVIGQDEAVSAVAAAVRRSRADRKSTRLNSSHITRSRMPSSA